MRTLMIVEPGAVPIPPDALLGVLEAFRAWRERWRHKMESFEFFAGRGGGWGVFNTDDETELSQIEFEFPLAPFSVIHVYPTVNGDDALARLTETFKQMRAAMGGGTP